jgi:membrane peptidoglycan carboxypeptidase
MTHYIADLAVFGHVMGASTAWGTETHHSDYEDYVDARTSTYTGSFNTYLSYDGSLTTLTAYNAAVNIAYDTTFGGNNHLTCVWIDTNYNWSNLTFSGRCGQSLNLAVNDVADVLHTLYQEASPTPTSTPTATPTPSPSPTSSSSASPTPTPSPTPLPTSNPTTTQSTTPTLPPTNTPVPTGSITPKSSLTPIPSPTQNLTPTPTIPEFPTAQLLTVTMLTVTAAALACKKTALKK